ncbi:MAG: hypothetical protein ABI859_05235 [Pseudomonadota bacterium]
MDDFPDEEFSLLAANDPCSDTWDETSFLGQLMEDALFDEEGYAAVETAMIRAVMEGPDFQTLGVFVRISERITLMLKRHIDPADDYTIENLDDEQVAELDRRVRYALQEISLGNTPDMSRWDN